MSFLVALSGQRGSGKTWLAAQMASHHGFAKTSFGDVVRAEAQRVAIAPSVDNLQALGAQLFDEWGADRLSTAALSRLKPDGDGVVEGIRHLAVLESLKAQAAPRRFVAVFLDLADDQRRLRLRLRDGDDGSRQDARGVERQLQELRARANLIIDGSSPEIEAQLVGYLQSIDPDWQPRLHT